jgi:uncharacterized protein YkwD
MTRTRTLTTFLLAVGLLGTAAPATAQATARTRLLHRINHVRAVHGLPAVHPARQLHAAAARHSHDMMARDYFAHTSPTGSTLESRITRSGFVDGYAWRGGETLAWGTTGVATPRWSVHAWMHSPEHRAILLSATFRRIGISRTCGRFKHHPDACVWTADWVQRSK